MEILKNLFYGFPDLWGGGVAHSVMILSLVIALGLCLGKLRVKGVSLGLAWILFIGLIFGHFSLNLDEHLLHFLKEFGLILFVYSIGLEVGPGFFASFKNGGKSLNLLSMIVVALSIITTLVIFSFSGTSITSMAGILSGAVTNTPGLGAAQQAFSDLRHIDAPSIAAGYAIAYPMGVLGVILSFIILRFALRVDKQKEEDEAKRGKGHLEAMTLNTFAVKVSNQMVFKDTVKQIRYLLKRDFMVSKIIRNNGERQNEVVNGQTVIEEGDILQIVAHPTVEEPIIALLGEKVDVKDEEFSSELINRRILITKPGINGKSISQLQIRSNLGANITRVNRNGVDLIATPDLKLQLGDRVTVVGKELAIAHNLPELRYIKRSKPCAAGNQYAFGGFAAGQLVFGILAHSEVLGIALCKAVKHIVHSVFEALVILPDFHAVYHFHQRIHVAFFLRPLKDDVGHKGAVQEGFCFCPELVALLAVAFGVGNQGGNKFQNIAFRLDIGHGVVVHGF